MGDLGWTSDAIPALGRLPATEFTGYTETESEAHVLALIDAETTEELPDASDGKVMLVLDRTPFYGEGGGQVGDTGVIECAGRSIPVVDTKKNSGIYMHICELDGTPVSVGDTVTARIDAARLSAAITPPRICFRRHCAPFSETMSSRQALMWTRSA